MNEKLIVKVVSRGYMLEMEVGFVPNWWEKETYMGLQVIP